MDSVVAFLDKAFALLGLDTEGGHLSAGRLRLELLLGVVVYQLQSCVLVEVHSRRHDPVAFRAENRALALRSNERTLILVVNRASHDNLVSLRRLQGPRTLGRCQRRSAALDQVFHQTGSFAYQVAIPNVDCH